VRGIKVGTFSTEFAKPFRFILIFSIQKNEVRGRRNLAKRYSSVTKILENEGLIISLLCFVQKYKYWANQQKLKPGCT